MFFNVLICALRTKRLIVIIIIILLVVFQGDDGKSLWLQS